MLAHDALEVWVELDGVPVRAGTLGASFAAGRALGGSWFGYDADYWRHPLAYAIDPRLPKSASRAFAGEDMRLFGAIEDLTPDDWGRRIIDAELSAARRDRRGTQGRGTDAGSAGEFDYLTLTSDAARLGAIRLRVPGAAEWLSEAGVSDLGATGVSEYAAAAARFEAHEATQGDLELLGAPGTSAGGARPKVTLVHQGRLRLIKLPSERDRGRDGEAWEYVTLQLAHSAGISAQHGTLLPGSQPGAKSSLMLDRFDRTPEGQRIGYMSARTAMELGDQAHNRVTYEDLADTVDTLTLGDRSQLADLFKRVALTLLVNNVDDHWKNHGFLRVGDRWQLSPAFDINPSTTRGVVTSRQVSRTDDPRQRDLRNLVRTADVYALSKLDTARALEQVLTAVLTWESHAQAVGISAGEIREMSSAFSREQQEFAHAAIAELRRGVMPVDLGSTGSSGM